MDSRAALRRGLLALLMASTAACSAGVPVPAPSLSAAPPPSPPSLQSSPSAQPSSTPVPPSSGARPQPVIERPTDSWRIAGKQPTFGTPWARRPVPVVEGFANLASVDPGQRVTLYVSTTAPHWRATAYRMGWYSGHVAAKVWRSPWERRVRQPGPRTSGSTHTPSAPWRASLSVTTTGWRPGTYLIRLDARGGSSYVPLTVRSPSTAGRLVMLTPDTTWQAYNDWGGRNLYWGPAGNGDGAHRARAVTFDRPYAEGHGAGEYLTRMLAVVTLAERLRLPLAYADDVDLQSRPHLLAGAAGVISMGHDEYWSVPMRAALSAARNAGTNVAFLGANAIDRRIRLSSTATGPYRLMVNYKDAREDPLSRSDPKLTTADWSLPPAADPQRTLTGEPYACFPGHGDLVVASPTSWLLAGTGLRPGDRIPGAIGPEFDAVDPRQSMPHPLDVVFHSPVVCRNWRFSDATYYVARSGAGVLDIGTMGWLKALNGGAGVRARSRAVRITSTVLTAFARPRAGLAHPAADSVRRIYRGGR